MGSTRKKVIVAVSGGFDPLHIGHVRLFEEAKKLGDELVVIMNNDNWLMKKKGYVFMPQNERKELIRALGVVDRLVTTNHPRNPEKMGVVPELQKIRPNIFANGGDVSTKNDPNTKACKKIGCKLIFNIGRRGKVQSSSWLVENLLKEVGVIQKQTSRLKEEYKKALTRKE